MKVNVRLVPATILFCISTCYGQEPVEHVLPLDEKSANRPSGMIAAYAENRNRGIGNYVTHDIILLGQVLSIEEATTQAEREIYSKEVQAILDALSSAASHAKASSVTSANQQFLNVLNALMTGQVPPDGPVKYEVAKVKAASEIGRSGIVPETIDYTQFRIRGNYTRTPELGRYFQTVRYGGTVLFAVKESGATGLSVEDADLLTAQALQLACWISASSEAAAAYKKYLEQTRTLFGDPDDLTMEDVLAVRQMRTVQQKRAAILKSARKSGRQPQILGGMIDLAKLEQGVTAEDALTGWRLFPQARSSDGPAFQQLVYPHSGQYLGKGTPHSMDMINGKQVKAFPLGMELPALLGSAAAQKALDASGEQDYEGYKPAFVRASKLLGTNLNIASWVPVFRQLIQTKTDSPDQLLTSSLAYWTRNRHRGLLYEKQTYTPVEKGITIAPKRTAAYLEPSTALYQSLAAQTLALTGALKPETVAALQGLLAACVEISGKETAGIKLSEGQILFLNDIDSHFMSLAGREDSPVVVDVHTNPNSKQVLEEATGFPVMVELRKGDQLMMGARMSHFEFRQPLDQRMTDEEWTIRARSWKQ